MMSSRCCRPVTMITGSSIGEYCLRSVPRTSRPDIPGISTSSRTSATALRLDDVERFGAAGGEQDLVAEPLQPPRQHVAVRLGVVDEQQRCGGPRHERPACSAA